MTKDDRATAGAEARLAHVRPPALGLPVLRWEYKELFEKNEKFNVVTDKKGDPVVCLSWVVIYLQAVDGTEIELEVDREHFDRYFFPHLLYPSLLFWRQVKSGDALYPQRASWLARLETWNHAIEPR